MKSITQLSVFFAIAGVVLTAPGQTTNVILQTDFDGDAGQGNFTGASSWAGAGSELGTAAAGINAQGLTTGIGVGGSSANEISPDYTQLSTDPNWTTASSYVYAQAQCGAYFGAPITPVTPTSPLSSMLSSLIVSADVQVSGLLPGQYGASVYVSKLRFFDSANNLLFDFNGWAGWAGQGSWTHISVPVSSLTYFPYSHPSQPVTDFTNADVVASIASFQVEFEVHDTVGQLGGTGANMITPIFGFTSTGLFVVDNIHMAQVLQPSTPTAPPTPKTEQVIWQDDFDRADPNSYSFGFQFRDGTPSATFTVSANQTGGVGGSASTECTVDFSSWNGSAPTSYSGFGVGAAESPISLTLASSDKALYRVYFAAKVGGTSASDAGVPVNVDLNFFTPGGQQVYDLTASVTLSNTWQSFVLYGTNMQIASWLNGAQQLFNQNYATVSKLEVQLTAQGGPDIGSVFGYDANNTMDIDNIKVVQLLSGLAPLSIVQNSGGQLRVTWSDPTDGGTAKLQSATSVTGPYVDVAGASSATASPYTVPAGSQQQFFRTVWVH
jgi:hypothetical protein